MGFRMVVKGVSDYAMQSRDSLVVKELLTTTENQRYIPFKKQARYKLHKIVTKTEGKDREMRSKQQNHAQ